MRGKKAKALREFARSQTIGRRWESYTNREIYTSEGIPASMLILRPDHGKGFYRALKKRYKEVQRYGIAQRDS